MNAPTCKESDTPLEPDSQLSLMFEQLSQGTLLRGRVPEGRPYGSPTSSSDVGNNANLKAKSRRDGLIVATPNPITREAKLQLLKNHITYVEKTYARLSTSD